MNCAAHVKQHTSNSKTMIENAENPVHAPPPDYYLTITELLESIDLYISIKS